MYKLICSEAREDTALLATVLPKRGETYFPQGSQNVHVEFLAELPTEIHACYSKRILKNLLPIASGSTSRKSGRFSPMR